MKEKEFYSLVSDTTFKYLFQNNKTRKFFDELIKYYTGIDISKYIFLNNELSSGNRYVSYRLDNLLSNEDKSIIINIEMNKKYKDYTDVRNRRYLHTIAGISKDSKNYNDKKVVIQLNFNNYLSHENKDICTNTYMLKDSENDLVIEDFKIHNIYLPQEEKMCYNEDIKKKLKLFLCNSYEEMREVAETDKEMNNIVDEIERLNQEKFFGALYNIEEENKKLQDSARSSGYTEGLYQGAYDNSLEIAKKLKEKNIDIKIIEECSGLTLDEIEKL